MKVEAIAPHGFCAGVTGAVRKALSLKSGAYCLHELVHNELVVDGLKKRGIVFVESLDEVPPGATVLFSAHGVAPSVRCVAESRGLVVVDATCPFVTRVHKAAKAFSEKGLPVVVIGHPAHAEVKGIVGEICEGRAFVYPDLPDARRIGVVSQTTMNADEVARIVSGLRKRFDVETTAEVCHATKERQDAVKAFRGDAILVLGSAQSSNTKRLCEVAQCRTFRAGTMEEVKLLDFCGIGALGVTSGASTPEDFFESALEYLKERWQ
jgi:4-hydroxy-3-methylbut-2-enyl diphosphate reductase